MSRAPSGVAVSPSRSARRPSPVSRCSISLVMRASSAGLISWKLRRGPVFSGARTTSSTTTRRDRVAARVAELAVGAPARDRMVVTNRAAVAKERRGVALLQQRVLRGNERGRGAVARLEEQRLLHRRQLFARAQVGVHVGAAKRVDRLLGIADQGEHAGRARVEEEPPEDVPLRLVGVLELVDERVAIAARAARRAARACEDRRPPDCARPA